MIKSFYLSLACVGVACSLFASNANEEIARGEERGGGGGHHDNREDDHRDNNRNDERHDYNRYEDHRNGGYDHHDGYRYDQNRWNNGGGAYSEGIYDGVLLNNTYNPDVQYTQPGSTDNFNQVYEQNQQ